MKLDLGFLIHFSKLQLKKNKTFSGARSNTFQNSILGAVFDINYHSTCDKVTLKLSTSSLVCGIPLCVLGTFHYFVNY